MHSENCSCKLCVGARELEKDIISATVNSAVSGSLSYPQDRNYIPIRESGGKDVRFVETVGVYKNSSVLALTGYRSIDEFLKECLDTMRSKGHDYRQGNDDDLLHNFRTVADQIDTSMEKVWLTYFYKHYSALVTYIKEGGQQESEPIEGRIKDMIVYLLLFYHMTQEGKKQESPKTTWAHLLPLANPAPINQGSEPAPGSLEPTNVVVQVEAPAMDTKGRPSSPGSLGSIEINMDRMKKNAGLEPTNKSMLGDQMSEDELRSLEKLPGGVVETAKYVTETLNERDVRAAPGPVSSVDEKKLRELREFRRYLDSLGPDYIRVLQDAFKAGGGGLQTEAGRKAAAELAALEKKP